MPYRREVHLAVHDFIDDAYRGKEKELPVKNVVIDESGTYGEVLYRPGELLVAVGDLALARRLPGLERIEALPLPAPPEEIPEVQRTDLAREHEPISQPDRARPRASEGVVRVAVPQSDGLLDLVRNAADEALKRFGRPLRLGPNYVFQPLKRFGTPAGPAIPTNRPLPPPTGNAGAGVAVGVLDTSILPTHPWLDGHVRALHGSIETAPADGASVSIYRGHATAVAGVIRRIAPGAGIVAAKVLDDLSGDGDDYTIANRLRELAAAGVRVACLALACTAEPAFPPLALQSAIAEVSPHMAVVAAAGNKPDGLPVEPASMKRVYGVAAVDRDWERAAFSNFGDWVDACAPGVDIETAFYTVKSLRIMGVENAPSFSGTWPDFDGTAAMMGTSFAAPQLAGAIAAVMSHAGVGPHEAAARILSRGPRIPDIGTGIGRHVTPVAPGDLVPYFSA